MPKLIKDSSLIHTSAKMADAWAIDNMWIVYYQATNQRQEFMNYKALMRAITKGWKGIAPEKCV